jgi:hypothetical protein
MRTSDKKKNMQKVNILAESLYKQRTNEDYDYAAVERDYYDKEYHTNSQEQPKMDDDEQMYYYISKYVKDPDNIDREMANYHSMGYQGLSDDVKANLSRDIDFMTYVQMGHDEETFRKETNNEDFDYAAAERDYHDKEYYDHDMKLEELGRSVEEAIQGLRGDWSVKKRNNVFVITNASIQDKEMEIGLSIDRPEFKDEDYAYYYELKGVNPKSDPSMGGHQGNYTIEKSRCNNPADLFLRSKHPYESWFR